MENVTVTVEAAHAPTVLRSYARCLANAGDAKRAQEVFAQARAADDALSAAALDKRVADVAKALGIPEAQVRDCVAKRQKGDRPPAASSPEHRIWTLLAG